MKRASAQRSSRKAAKSAKCSEDGHQCTVEEYLQEQCDVLIQGITKHADRLIGKLREELESSSDELKKSSVQQQNKTGKNNNLQVILTVSSGPYTGQTFSVCPQMATKNTIYIGRSTGKKFREKGVSLPDDPEVSTTHGKIEEKKGKIFFTDTGSTNGSAVDGVDVDEGDIHELVTGTDLRVGNTEFAVEIAEQ
jgi:hypothetical protein